MRKLVTWIPTPIGSGWEVEPDPVIWLDVGKMETAFRRNAEQYVGKGGSGAGQPSRYAHVGAFIASGYPVFMPHISLHSGDIIWFTDGRHRFAWVRDHCARAIPVTTNPESLEALSKSCGTEIRECLVAP